MTFICGLRPQTQTGSSGGQTQPRVGDGHPGHLVEVEHGQQPDQRDTAEGEDEWPAQECLHALPPAHLGVIHVHGHPSLVGRIPNQG